MVNWVGTFHFTIEGVRDQSFEPSIFSTTIQPGTALTPAIVDFVFSPNTVLTHLFQATQQLVPAINDVLALILQRRSLYTGYNNIMRQYTTGGPVFQIVDIAKDYIGYNDILSNPNPQANPPPHVIRFTSDGVISLATAGTISTADVEVITGDTAAVVAASVVKAVNTSFTEQITIVSTPNFGDIVEISNGGTDFNVIWFEGSTKPLNTGVREAIFVQFAGGDTITQIAEKTVTALERGVMGVPRAADLGLQFAGTPTSPIAPTYFMVL